MALVGSRRDTAKEQTRRALLASALRMFSEQGLDGPSLDAICEDAGYTRGAFYVHFKNREALIVAVVSDVIGVFVDTVVQAGDGHDLVRSVRSYTTLYRLATEGNDVVSSTTGTVLSASIALKKMHVVLEACERSPAVRQTFAQLVMGAQGQLAESVRLGQASGTVRADLDPESTASILVSIVLGQLVYAQVDIAPSLPAIEEQVLRLLCGSA